MRGSAWVLVAFGLLGCDSIEVGRAPGADPPTPRASPVEDPGDAPCESLTRAQCLGSIVCTLDAPSEQRSSRYTCRPARGNCEIGLTQTAESRDRCDDREGCAWQAGGCYCACRGAGRTAVEDGSEAQDCDCECAGGPPPGCRPR